MAEVGQWYPDVGQVGSQHAALLSKVALNLGNSDFGLSQHDTEQLRVGVNLNLEKWRVFIRDVDSQTLVDWMKALTVLERDLSGFELGDRSPVIAFYRELKNRDAVPEGFVKWIRAHTTNRFLPYGNLFDRI